jgi:hypothetical protein
MATWVRRFWKINHYEKKFKTKAAESIQMSLYGEFFIQKEKKTIQKRKKRSRHKCTTKDTHTIIKTEHYIA